jgi:hypothetical protein
MVWRYPVAGHCKSAKPAGLDRMFDVKHFRLFSKFVARYENVTGTASK